MRPAGRAFFLWGSLLAFAAVAAGAFGAHGLKSRLSPQMLDIFELAARYQVYHSLALMIVGLAGPHAAPARLRWAGYGFIAGILLFSGSLYLLALTGASLWGAVTPIGGVSFLLGWLCLASAFWPGNGR
ncbi:MAG: DUF423 domain-containing protein [Acidobacteria bacterium]|nr:DUF423 domain-containing protein [Acidobacteriota bacterium]